MVDQRRGKKKENKYKSKSLRRSKSLGKKTKEKCWNCGETGHFRKDCKEEKKKNKYFSDFESEKSSQDEGE